MTTSCRGSPPRVRGKPGRAHPSWCSSGITPACAGKTIRYSSQNLRCRDHPRVCGENRFRSEQHAITKGSPPRVRGKQHLRRDSLGREGITPACAGKTSRRPWASCRSRDHPRVCGENPHGAHAKCRRKGSPPRVRGKHRHPVDAVDAAGITPACAGKTSHRSLNESTQRDHPRVCGENSLNLRLMPLAAGSPPRVRGKLGKRYGIFKENGITPACAGKTHIDPLSQFIVRDHPRVCGENIM